MSIRRFIQTLIIFVLVQWLPVSAIDVERSKDFISQTDRLQTNQTQQRRLQWHLSEQEWQRYEQLMQGIRGSISPATISPLEVLGTHARNDQERQKYARQWARMMHDDVEQILRFQTAYNVAWVELYGKQPLVDINQLNLKSKQPAPWKQGDRILVFIKTRHCQRCQVVVHHAAKRALAVGAFLDVYVVSTEANKDDDLIRHWAQAASIDPKDVKAKRITLNYEQGQLMQITGKVVTQFPLVFRSSGDQLTAIPINTLQ